MHPILFQSGWLTLYSYGVLAAAGFLAALLLAHHRASRMGLDPNSIWNLGIYGILVSLAGSKLWLILSEWDYFRAHPRQVFTWGTVQSAGDYYGGMVGGVVFILLYTYFQKLSFWSVMDLLAAPIAIGHAIGRLGCFAAGCCYGKPTALDWGVTFTSPLAEKISGTPLGIALHPTQLYESAAEFMNFAILLWLGAKRRFAGQIIGAYFILYGFERGTIEFFRGDPGRTLLFHDRVSLMQLVSVALILGGAFLWLRPRGEAPAPVKSARPARAAAGRS
ncbi:MAG TPA: prolipoprotein diacylglyceryl transferase [Candidatus Acidoferrum sp.]|jgi:phosphatidylglycerol---prolipoprotein diacylglyceryl transferase|nr:prolipoprotein diacylglyceryl transferase [Candidatus Acidoferrum sp.]